MSRSSWKNLFFSLNILKKMSLKARDKAINGRSVFSRSSNTPTFLKNEPFFVYNGKRFKCVNVYPTLLRKKIGEFAMTRKPFHFPKKKRKKKKKIK